MLSDLTIRELIQSRDLLVETASRHIDDGWGPVLDSQFQPASIDLRLGVEFRRHPCGSEVALDEFHSYSLAPGECLLGCTLEHIKLPPWLSCRVEGKSSVARNFVSIHSAGFIDPGFYGEITLEIKNDGHRRFELIPGMLIAQISFITLDRPAGRAYGHPELKSHYQGQVGPTPGRFD